MKRDLVIKYQILLKAALTAVLLANTVAALNVYTAPLLKVFLAGAGMLIAADFFTGRRLWRDRGIWILLAFCLCYAVTVWRFRDYYFVKNIKALAYMAVFFIVFYGGAGDDADTARTERRVLGHVYLAAAFLLTAGSLATFCMGMQETYVTVDGITGYLGLFDGSLAGLYNSNTGGAVYAAAILICLAFLHAGCGRSRLMKAVYIADLVLTGLCMILTYSRTSLYALAIALGAGCVPLLRDRIPSDRPAAGLAVRLLCGAAVCGILIGASGPAHDLLMKLSPVQSSAAEETGGEDTDALRLAPGRYHAAMISLSAAGGDSAGWSEVEKELNDTLSRRLTMWDVGRQVFEDHPVWGVTYEAIPDMAFPHLHYPGEMTHLQGGGLHNLYLTVLVAAGVVGAVPLTAFTVYQCVRVWRARRRIANGGSACLVWGALILLMFLAMELMENRIMFRFEIFYALFWYVLGQFCGEIRRTGGEA